MGDYKYGRCGSCRHYGGEVCLLFPGQVNEEGLFDPRPLQRADEQACQYWEISGEASASPQLCRTA